MDEFQLLSRDFHWCGYSFSLVAPFKKDSHRFFLYQYPLLFQFPVNLTLLRTSAGLAPCLWTALALSDSSTPDFSETQRLPLSKQPPFSYSLPDKVRERIQERFYFYCLYLNGFQHRNRWKIADEEPAFKR